MPPPCTVYNTAALVERASRQVFATIGAPSEKTCKSAHVPIGIIIMVGTL